MDKLQELKQKQKELTEIKKQILQKSNEVFDEFCKDIFIKCPRLESFGWNQYTPYFNDGDTCVFSVNIDYLYINGQSVDDSEWINKKNITKYGEWNREQKQYIGREEEDNPNYDEELVDIYEQISSFLSNFDNDFYMSKFGDHVEITITKTGIDVFECEHD
jgi:hypothetical protein